MSFLKYFGALSLILISRDLFLNNLDTFFECYDQGMFKGKKIFILFIPNRFEVTFDLKY